MLSLQVPFAVFLQQAAPAAVFCEVVPVPCEVAPLPVPCEAARLPVLREVAPFPVLREVARLPVLREVARFPEFDVVLLARCDVASLALIDLAPVPATPISRIQFVRQAVSFQPQIAVFPALTGPVVLPVPATPVSRIQFVRRAVSFRLQFVVFPALTGPVVLPVLHAVPRFPRSVAVLQGGFFQPLQSVPVPSVSVPLSVEVPLPAWPARLRLLSFAAVLANVAALPLQFQLVSVAAVFPSRAANFPRQDVAPPSV